MITHPDQLNYESYLLRLWQVQQGGRPVWRASLESTRTGTRENFADVKLAFAFLHTSLQRKCEKGIRRPKKTRTYKRGNGSS
jgi:hypothetical protein